MVYGEVQLLPTRECSLQVPVSIRLRQAVFFFVTFFWYYHVKMGSFNGLPSSYQLSF